MGKFLTRGGLFALLVASLALIATIASGARQQAAGKPTRAQWAAIVAAAKKEGSVNIYTTGAPANYANLAAKFKAIYGITVNVNRQVDNTLIAQITAEEGTGKAVADIWSSNVKGYALGAQKNGWVVDAIGPNFFAKRYDRSKLLIGKAWVSGSALLGAAYNTSAYPAGVTDMTDFLNPAFKGKLGIPDPRISPANVDWYHWLTDTYGSSFLEKLAAQSPIVYNSSLTEAQAVASGEIIGGTQVAGSSAIQLQNAGAPIKYLLPNKGNAWNSGYIAMILKQAPHPNAAQVLANFLISPTGQALANAGLGALYPNIPGTWYSPPRVPRANDLAPAKVSAFITQWSALFLH